MAAKTYLAMLMANHCSLGQLVRPQSHSPGDWQGTLWQKCISQHVGKLLLEVACCCQLKLVTKRLYMHYKGCICIIALATSSCPQFAQKILICLQTTRFFAFRVKLYHCNRHISKVVTFTSLFLACIVLFFFKFLYSLESKWKAWKPFVDKPEAFMHSNGDQGNYKGASVLHCIPLCNTCHASNCQPALAIRYQLVMVYIFFALWQLVASSSLTGLQACVPEVLFGKVNTLVHSTTVGLIYMEIL